MYFEHPAKQDAFEWSQGAGLAVAITWELIGNLAGELFALDKDTDLLAAL